MAQNLFPHDPVLIVDDEPYILLSLSGALESNGINNIITCRDGRQVMKILSSRAVDVLLLDLNMPLISGKELLPEIRLEYPDIPVIIITGITEVATAVECMKMGVFDYLVKTIEEKKLQTTVSRAIEIRELKRENKSLSRHLINRELEQPEAFRSIVTNNPGMYSLLMYVESIAHTPQTVLLTGETGVGKDLFAAAIHTISGREGEFVPVNIAGLDDGMFTDTLFGHLKGAYTGAGHGRNGLIERAAAGTLFLDEIGDLNTVSQVKLLRLLETGQYYPLGSDLAKRTAARIIVSTNRDLNTEMSEGRFRKDLYYRLNTHHIHVPPLKERSDDLPLLFDYLLDQAARELGKTIPKVPAELLAFLKSYSFPGNVRELKSLIYDALNRHRSGALSLQIFEAAIGELNVSAAPAAGEEFFAVSDRFPTIRQAIESLIEKAMIRAGGNQAAAARLLGISPAALSKRLKKSRG